MGNDARCFSDYDRLGKCDSYFNSIFNDIRYDFYHYKEEFKKKIDEFDDPILRHIALYLVENYCASKKYFSTDGKWQNNYACDSLNKWLDNKKSYFTHARHCEGNVQLWDKTIEPLWDELVNKSKDGNLKNNENNKWCERNKYFRGHLELPEKLKPPRCYKHIPKEHKCVLPFPPNICNLKNTCNTVKNYYMSCKQKNGGKDFTDFSSLFSNNIVYGESPLQRIDDPTFSRQVNKNCECPSLEYATPISFTPFGSKLSYGGKNRKRLRDNFNEEIEYEEYARSMNKNQRPGRRRNNIYYDSVRN